MLNPRHRLPIALQNCRWPDCLSQNVPDDMSTSLIASGAGRTVRAENRRWQIDLQCGKHASDRYTVGNGQVGVRRVPTTHNTARTS